MYHIPVMHVGDSPWPPRPIVLWFSDSHVLDIGTQEQEVLGKARQDEMIRNKRGLVIPAFNPSIWEAKVSLGRKEGRERKKKKRKKSIFYSKKMPLPSEGRPCLGKHKVCQNLGQCINCKCACPQGRYEAQLSPATFSQAAIYLSFPKLQLPGRPHKCPLCHLNFLFLAKKVKL
jgi:hypothetical protein